MGNIIDVKQFETFMTDVKEAVGQFRSQSTEISTLRQAIHDLEQKVLTQTLRHVDQISPYGFTDAATAKKFMGFMKGVFLRDPMIRDMSEGVDSEGGYLVPAEWSNTLIQMLQTYGVARRECTVLPMSREELVMPKLTGGVQVYWIGEGKTISNTQPSFGEIKMVAKKLAALVPMTSELLADTAIQFANLLLTLFAQAIAKEEDRVAFVGNVSGASDPFNGLLYDPDVNGMSLAGGSTGFTSVDADFLADVTASVLPVAADGAKWYMHRTVFNILRKLQTKEYNGSTLVNSGEYIFQSPVGSAPGTIWGYPYVLVESMPAITASGAGKPFILFGNMQHYYIGDRQQLSVARSEHVGFAQDKIYLRVIQREGMGAAIPEAFTVVKTAAA